MDLDEISVEAVAVDPAAEVAFVEAVHFLGLLLFVLFAHEQVRKFLVEHSYIISFNKPHSFMLPVTPNSLAGK